MPIKTNLPHVTSGEVAIWFSIPRELNRKVAAAALIEHDTKTGLMRRILWKWVDDYERLIDRPLVPEEEEVENGTQDVSA